MTTFLSVVQAAIPSADAELCDFILWERTPFPCGPVSARSLFKTASRFHRAEKNKIRLCDMCDNQANSDTDFCDKCLLVALEQGDSGD